MRVQIPPGQPIKKEENKMSESMKLLKKALPHVADEELKQEILKHTGLDKYVGLTPEQHLATYLHEKNCMHNHTDGCGWYYSNWKKPGYAKKEYLAKAKRLLKVSDLETVINIVDEL